MKYTTGSRVADLMRSAAFLLLAVLTVMAVGACGGSEDTPDTPEPPVPPEPLEPKTEFPIAFSGSLSESESETRATPPAALQEYPDAEHGHKTFYVWSYKNPTASTCETVMKNYTVNWTSGSAGTTTTNSSGWEYVNQQPTNGTEQSIKYWDFTADGYRFFGYTGSGVSASYSTSEADPTSVSLTISGIDATAYSSEATPSSTIPLYSKLWYKTGSAIAASIQPVTLEFIPPVARVRFMFTFVEGLSFGREFLYNVKFHPTATSRNVAKEGSVTITYPLTGSDIQESWTSSNTDYYDNADLAIDYYESSVTSQRPELDTPQHWYYVLPQKGSGTGGQGSYTLSVSVGGSGDPKTCEVPAGYMTWAPGYDYTYIFKITEGGGVSLDNVQVGINSWVVKQAVERPVYNW